MPGRPLWHWKCAAGWLGTIPKPSTASVPSIATTGPQRRSVPQRLPTSPKNNLRASLNLLEIPSPLAWKGMAALRCGNRKPHHAHPHPLIKPRPPPNSAGISPLHTDQRPFPPPKPWTVCRKRFSLSAKASTVCLKRCTEWPKRFSFFPKPSTVFRKRFRLFVKRCTVCPNRCTVSLQPWTVFLKRFRLFPKPSTVFLQRRTVFYIRCTFLT